MDGKDVYLAHLNHIEIRRKDKTFFVDNCPACDLHRRKEEKAALLREASRKIVRSWEQYEQR